MTLGAAARRFLPPLLLILVGMLVAGLSGGRTAVVAIGLFVAGVGGVWGVSAAFYEIGRSEDRDREAGRS